MLAILHEAELRTHPKPDKWLMVTLRSDFELLAPKRIIFRLPLDDFFSLEAEPIRDPLETVLPKELTEAERQILIWRFEEQLDYVEMSERLGVTQNACRLRLYVGGQRVPQVLEQIFLRIFETNRFPDYIYKIQSWKKGGCHGLSF